MSAQLDRPTTPPARTIHAGLEPLRTSVAPNRRGKKIALTILAVGLVSAVIAAPMVLRSTRGVRRVDEGLVTQVAVRAPLRIAVTNTGYIDSLKSITLASEVEYKTTIIHIVPEGTRVHKDDIVCQLDPSRLEEELKEKEVMYVESEALLQQAKQDVEIQKTQNESDLADVELKLKLAKLDLDKFKSGDFPTLVSDAETEITLAEETLRRVQESYEFTKRLVKKGYRSTIALEADQSAMTKAQLQLQAARNKRKVLGEYTYTRTLSELEAAPRELERQLERVNHKAEAALVQANVRVSSHQRTVENRRASIDRIKKNIAACTIRAPQDGEVIYAQSSARRTGQSDLEIGAEIQFRQELIKLPNLAQMKVDARIHETRISQVKTGMPVTIQVDALANETFHGKVQYVSSVPMSGRWPNFELKEYEAIISIDDPFEQTRFLKPGLTAQIDIEVEEREQVLQVPVQAVVECCDQHFTYVLTSKGPERRTVQVGETNDTFIEIMDGVAEGEAVVLNVRDRFGQELAELENAMQEHAVEEAAQAEPAQPKAVAHGG